MSVIKNNFKMKSKSVDSNPLVSIVIINYNTAEVTIESIESIISNTIYQPYEIIIIDNASNSDDRCILSNYASERSLSIYLMDENIGWNSGVNYGFDKAQGSLLLTINSDVIVQKGWLDKMVSLYLNNENVAAINANIHESGKSIITHDKGFLKILHVACSMISSDAWHLVGQLDSKNFRFYGTENDWSYRARSMGYSLLLSEDSVVNHLGSSQITAGGGVSVRKTGKILEFLKMRLDGRVKYRIYNFNIREWLSREILSEFKHAYLNGYLTILISTYSRVFFNLHNIFSARKERALKRIEGRKVLSSTSKLTL